MSAIFAPGFSGSITISQISDATADGKLLLSVNHSGQSGPVAWDGDSNNWRVVNGVASSTVTPVTSLTFDLGVTTNAG